MKKKYSKKRLKRLIDAYVETDGVKSLAGLALYLGIDSKDGYSEIIAYARTCIEKDIVENGLRGKYNASMASFILRSSFGYRDKGELPPQGPVKIEVAEELLGDAV